MVKVTLRLDASGYGTILIDGVPIRGIQRTSLESIPGEGTRLTIDLVVEHIDVEAEAVLVPHIQREIERRVLGRS